MVAQCNYYRCRSRGRANKGADAMLGWVVMMMMMMMMICVVVVVADDDCYQDLMLDGID